MDQVEVKAKAQRKVNALAEFVHLQYNVYTARNTARGLMEGLGYSMPEMPPRKSKKRSRAEKAGYDMGRSIVEDAELMGEARITHLSTIVGGVHAIALERIQAAKEKDAKKKRAKQGSTEE